MRWDSVDAPGHSWRFLTNHVFPMKQLCRARSSVGQSRGLIIGYEHPTIPCAGRRQCGMLPHQADGIMMVSHGATRPATPNLKSCLRPSSTGYASPQHAYNRAQQAQKRAQVFYISVRKRSQREK